MKIYLINRTDDYGFDEFDSAIVCDTTPKKAMEFCEKYFIKGKMTCEFIGKASNKLIKGEILTSFNAG